jgi:hypothetical protein
MRNTADVTGGKPIAVVLQSISDVSANNPLVAFYDIHGGKREVLFFYFVSDTTRDETEIIPCKSLKCFLSFYVCVLFDRIDSILESIAINHTHVSTTISS